MAERDCYAIIASKHGYADSTLYKTLIGQLLTPEEAEIGVVILDKTEEVTPAMLSQEIGLDLDTINTCLSSLFRKGLVNYKDAKSRRGLRFARDPYFAFMTSLSDMGVDPTASPAYKSWYNFVKKEMYPDLAKMIGLTDIQYARVVPHYKALASEKDVAPQDDIREYVKAARIAVTDCSCRKCNAAGGEPCKRSDDYTICLNFGRAAEHIIQRGVGKAITSQEALKIIDECENRGLIHILDVGVATLCNCCTCCCIALSNCVNFSIPFSKIVFKSLYLAESDPDLCKGCKLCSKQCQFKAIEVVKDASGKVRSVTDPEKCFGCGACVVSCPHKARHLKPVRPQESLNTWEPFERWERRIKG